MGDRLKKSLRNLGTIRKGPVPGTTVIVAIFCAIGVVQAWVTGDTAKASTLGFITLLLAAMAVVMFRVGR